MYCRATYFGMCKSRALTIHLRCCIRTTSRVVTWCYSYTIRISVRCSTPYLVCTEYIGGLLNYLDLDKTWFWSVLLQRILPAEPINVVSIVDTKKSQQLLESACLSPLHFLESLTKVGNLKRTLGLGAALEHFRQALALEWTEATSDPLASPPSTDPSAQSLPSRGALPKAVATGAANLEQPTGETQLGLTRY